MQIREIRAKDLSMGDILIGDEGGTVEIQGYPIDDGFGPDYFCFTIMTQFGSLYFGKSEKVKILRMEE
jgi:hypothetical protein